MTRKPRDRVRELERENAGLRQAISLLHRIANLVRESVEVGPTCYAVLTGVTAGVGLGLNRAMLFLNEREPRDSLRGFGAVGPADAEEADRVWRSIAAEAPDLHTLYAAGVRRRETQGRLDLRVRGMRVPIDGQNPIALALRRAQPVFQEGLDDLGGLLHLPTGIAAPLRGRETLRGVLYADNALTGLVPDAGSREVFALVADHAGRALENAHRFEHVANQARTDALTGLPHHGAMWETLAVEVETARAGGTDLGLVMIDLDDFKKVNDGLGHLAGDGLLAAVAARLRSEARGEGTVFRYGGEEFAVLVPRADAAVLTRVAERLRRAICERPFPLGEAQVAVTCSMGVASLGPGHPNARALVAGADGALYRAKLGGKNRVERAAARDAA